MSRSTKVYLKVKVVEHKFLKNVKLLMHQQ